MDESRVREILAAREELIARCRKLAFIWLKLTHSLNVPLYDSLSLERVIITEPDVEEFDFEADTFRLGIRGTYFRPGKIDFPISAIWDTSWEQTMLERAESHYRESRVYFDRHQKEKGEREEAEERAEYLRLKAKYEG